MVLVLTGVKNDASAVPTEVLAVEGARQWSELGLPGDSGGVFIPSWRENQLALEDHRDPLHRAAAQHGYVHYLISKPDDRDVPLWYSEGFAELLSTVQKIQRERVTPSFPDSEGPPDQVRRGPAGQVGTRRAQDEPRIPASAPGADEIPEPIQSLPPGPDP